ncbi:transporter substrate-binding domain-containing protein [Shewanella sp. JBTF-M18]|uniref:Transporter substrate-binding domain-containing protein n=1 Tax=Shewanella insulae TaxID=2681496 RepID=A0A6L7HZ50_9GAMM|nr:transporter substrate-binding domain-containing protein [Shewanella insulae]MXR69622.1 transporter substrate-binding domain-containing protein [Shewanella insulae]
MRSWRYLMVILCACMLLGTPWAAVSEEAEEITVATGNWPGFSTPDGKGYYLALLQSAFPVSKWKLSIDFVPFSRALYMVKQKKVDVGLGFYIDEVEADYYCDIPVEVDQVDVALTPELAAIWQDINSLKKKKVKALLEYRYDTFIKVPMYYEEGSDLLQMLNHVNNGKIDAVLDYKRSLAGLASQLNRPQQYVIKENVLNPEVFFVFPQTQKGKRLKAIFNRAMARMAESGELDRLFRANISYRARVPTAN